MLVCVRLLTWLAPGGRPLKRGEGWLPAHPERELIARRYLARQPNLTREASEGRTHTDRDHIWHMETLGAICRQDDGLLLAAPYRLIDVTDADEVAAGVAWWEELTSRGGEGWSSSRSTSSRLVVRSGRTSRP